VRIDEYIKELSLLPRGQIDPLISGAPTITLMSSGLPD
jgi:hypothetical protein